MTRQTLAIEKLVLGGLGFGRLPDGMVVMLPGVLPGETVVFEPIRTRRSFCEARLVEILEPAPERGEPTCALYGACGGCDLQHAIDAAQPRLKHAMLVEQFERSGLARQGFALPAIAAVLPSPRTRGYRQRLKLQLNRGVPGFFHHRTHRHVPVAHCLIARPAVNEVLAVMSDKAPLSPWSANLHALEIQESPATGSVVCIFHLARPLAKKDGEHALRLAGQIPLISGLLVVGSDGRMTRKGLTDAGEDRDCTIEYGMEVQEGAQPFFMTVAPGGFCQVNPEQNQRMAGLVRDWARESGGGRMLDLYCGNGNFSVPLAGCFESVLGVDSEPASIRAAITNASRAGLINCRFEAGRAGQKAEALAVEGSRFDLVLLDPPRQGCDPGLAAYAARLAMKTLIYISCDPATLIRDLREILPLGFAVKVIQPLDMFPQTHHLETAVLLQRAAI